MRLPRTRILRRPAFTLIELLVVITIIAVLVSLTSAAVMRILWKGPELKDRSEISQMATSVSSFQQAFTVDYIPSRIRLREDGVYDVNNMNAPTAQYERDSLMYLQRLWPRLTFPVDWNGNGQIDAGTSPGTAYVDLEGDQCLVFFLGGIPNPTTPTNQGFSTNPANPSAP